MPSDDLHNDLVDALENLEHAVETLAEEDLKFAEMEALIALRNASMKINPAVDELKKEVRQQLEDSDVDFEL